MTSTAVTSLFSGIYPRGDDVAQGDGATETKMADVSGTELSDSKGAEIELKKRQKRPWEDLHKSAKIVLTPELPETLGFYDIGAVRRQQRELPAGNRQRHPPKPALQLTLDDCVFTNALL